MEIEQIRNATLKIIYGGVTFLVDPWLEDKGTGMSAPTVRPEMAGVKSPLNDLPHPPEEILDGVDLILVTHVHPDHFTEDYLPKEINILVPNETDQGELEKLGFINVSVIGSDGAKVGTVDIQKTPGSHGDSEELALYMGEVCGFYLTGEDKSLYIVGDTIFNEEVEETLKKYEPDVIVLNCCEATTPRGRLIMDLNDLKAVYDLCPEATVIASHLDSVNHALITSEDVREFVQKNHLKNVIVPRNGEWIRL